MSGKKTALVHATATSYCMHGCFNGIGDECDDQ